MSILVVRHGLSEANNRENYGSPAFGNPDAPLMEAGRIQAISVGNQLEEDFGIDRETDIVAVSTMLRTQETAVVAGFHKISIYPLLNEEKGNLADEEVRAAIDTKRPPELTRKAARFLIENKLPEKVWISHGLLIATICQELGVYTNERFTPRFGEIRELPL
jgi:broad specificity phosphatase PhoE